MITNSPEAFFGEMGEALLLVGEEVRPADLVEDRIDLLAVDPEGTSVIIELKRGSHKLHLLQAISYAAMVAKWDPHRLVESRQQFARSTLAQAEAELEDFLEGFGQLNDRQRIILIAEDFDFSVLAAAEWLTDNYAVDIRCYRLTISIENASEYMSCTCIYPPPELMQYATGRGGRTLRAPKWDDWSAALSDIENKAIVDFFMKELEAGRDYNLGKRGLWYRVGNRRCHFILARSNKAYVWQYSRFEGDVAYWEQKIGRNINLSLTNQGTCLRFYLANPEDFQAFLHAINNELLHMKWSSDLDTLNSSENKAFPEEE